MEWVIGLAVVVGLLVNWYSDSSAEASSLCDDSSGEDDSIRTSQFSSTSSLSDSSYSAIDNSPSINPANGLPMVGMVDIEGNPYGTDSSLWDNLSSSSSSMFDDTIISSNLSMFDESSSSIGSSSLFD